MHYNRPIVMCIGGFDPSGGAGLLADIKTLEQHKCLGFGVATCWTVQTEHCFLDISWLPVEKIIAQATPLLEQYTVAAIKIGVIENMQTLLSVVCWLKEKAKHAIIVWDPVLSASTGFTLTGLNDNSILKDILQHVFLITPNIPEAQLLTGVPDGYPAARHLSQYCQVLLKGGHAAVETGVDILITGSGAVRLEPGSKALTAKHGSGCILSSAIAAHLAHDVPLEEACRKAKYYIESILKSNSNLLGYHHV